MAISILITMFFLFFLTKRCLVFKISQKFHTFKAICSNFYLNRLHKIALQKTRTSTFIIKIKTRLRFYQSRIYGLISMIL